MRKIFKLLIPFSLLTSCVDDNNVNSLEQHTGTGIRTVDIIDTTNNFKYGIFYKDWKNDMTLSKSIIVNQDTFLLEMKCLDKMSFDILKINFINFEEIKSITEKITKCKNILKINFDVYNDGIYALEENRKFKFPLRKNDRLNPDVEHNNLEVSFIVNNKEKKLHFYYDKYMNLDAIYEVKDFYEKDNYVRTSLLASDNMIYISEYSFYNKNGKKIGNYVAYSSVTIGLSRY